MEKNLILKLCGAPVVISLGIIISLAIERLRVEATIWLQLKYILLINGKSCKIIT
jgi:hypothetical protein